jgi:hypothetical protein
VARAAATGRESNYFCLLLVIVMVLVVCCLLVLVFGFHVCVFSVKLSDKLLGLYPA